MFSQLIRVYESPRGAQKHDKTCRIQAICSKSYGCVSSYVWICSAEQWTQAAGKKKQYISTGIIFVIFPLIKRYKTLWKLNHCNRNTSNTFERTPIRFILSLLLVGAASVVYLKKKAIQNWRRFVCYLLHQVFHDCVMKVFVVYLCTLFSTHISLSDMNDFTGRWEILKVTKFCVTIYTKYSHDFSIKRTTIHLNSMKENWRIQKHILRVFIVYLRLFTLTKL